MIRHLIATALGGILTMSAPALADMRKDDALIEKGSDLSFGLVAGSDTAGTATVTPAGATSCAGGIRCLGEARPALFYLTGPKDAMVGIAVSPALLSNGKGASLSAALTPSDAVLILRPGKRKNSFTVGGTLGLPARVPAGNYAGSYSLIVEYF